MNRNQQKCINHLKARHSVRAGGWRFRRRRAEDCPPYRSILLSVFIVSIRGLIPRMNKAVLLSIWVRRTRPRWRRAGYLTNFYGRR